MSSSVPSTSSSAEAKVEPSTQAAATDAAAPLNDEERGLVEYPDWDSSSVGLPPKFILYSYNRLKG